MSSRCDPIFWAATGFFMLALVLGAAVDARQMQIYYQAGNVAFAVIVIGNIVVMLYLMSQNDHTWEKLLSVLIVVAAFCLLRGAAAGGDEPSPEGS